MMTTEERAADLWAWQFIAHVLTGAPQPPEPPRPTPLDIGEITQAMIDRGAAGREAAQRLPTYGRLLAQLHTPAMIDAELEWQDIG